MEINVYYISYDKTDADERWAAQKGMLLPVDKFDLVSTYQDTAESVLDVLDQAFQKFNIGDRDGKRIRSMSVGDVVQVDGTSFLCQMTGWHEVRFNPTFVEWDGAKFLDPIYAEQIRNRKS